MEAKGNTKGYCEINFHMNVCAVGLALIARLEATRKWTVLYVKDEL